MRPVLADSSFFVALYNKREAAHSRCVAVYDALDAPLVTCEACITEVLHLLGHSGAVVDAMFTSVEQGSLKIVSQLSEHIRAVGGLMRRYRDTPAEFVDACLIQMADELDTGDILTLDGDFKHYRWRRNRRFRLLIPLD